MGRRHPNRKRWSIGTVQTAVRQKQSVPGMQKQQDSTPENRVSAQYHVPVCSSEKKEKKKGALDKRDEGESRATRIATTRPISLNRGSADFPTCRRIGILPRSRKVQHSRCGLSKGSADFLLPSKPRQCRLRGRLTPSTKPA